MAHQLYHTPALVIAYKDTGEANRVFYLLTRELGLVVAAAQGIRHLKSKLRGHLQVGRIVSVSLVRGREIWRIVGADTAEDLSALFRRSVGRRLVRLTYKLLRQLIHGEEYNPAIFDNAINSFHYVLSLPPAVQETKTLELLLQVRLLHHLGYLKPTLYVSPLVAHDEWNEETLAFVRAHQSDIEILIESTLLSTQLS